MKSNVQRRQQVRRHRSGIAQSLVEPIVEPPEPEPLLLLLLLLLLLRLPAGLELAAALLALLVPLPVWSLLPPPLLLLRFVGSVPAASRRLQSGV